MAEIKFNKDEKEQRARKIQGYFEQELDQSIGAFEAEFLLDFFAEEIGPFFYNRGLHDAQTIVEQNTATIADAIYEIEKPTPFAR